MKLWWGAPHVNFAAPDAPGHALGWVEPEPACISSVAKNPCTVSKKHVSGSRIGATSVPLIGQMSSIAALEKRVKALEDDEDFSKPSYVPPPPAASSASSAEVDALRKENAKLQDLLAKERYRIKHLIRAIEAKS